MGNWSYELEKPSYTLIFPILEKSRESSLKTSYNEFILASRQERRLTEAYEELMQCGQSVTMVAVRYGYDSTDSFTRAFKSQFGMVPSK